GLITPMKLRLRETIAVLHGKPLTRSRLKDRRFEDSRNHGHDWIILSITGYVGLGAFGVLGFGVPVVSAGFSVVSGRVLGELTPAKSSQLFWMTWAGSISPSAMRNR